MKLEGKHLKCTVDCNKKLYSKKGYERHRKAGRTV